MLATDVKEDTSIVIIQAQVQSSGYLIIVMIVQIKLSELMKNVLKKSTKIKMNVNARRLRMINIISSAPSTTLLTAFIQSWSVMVILPVIILKMRP